MRRALGLGAFLGALFFLAPPAMAVVVDGADVTATEADGKISAEVTLINTGEAATLTGSAVAGNCTVTTDDTALPARQTTVVTLDIPQACFPDGTGEITLTLDLQPSAGSIALPAVTITAPEQQTAAPVSWLWYALLIAVTAGFLVFDHGWMAAPQQVMGPDPSAEPPLEFPASGGTPATAGGPESSYGYVRSAVQGRLEELRAWSGLAWRPLVQVTPKPELANVDAKWSFKDSTISTATVVTTGIVALIGSTDLLTVLLGEKPAAATTNVILVSSLASVTLIGVAGFLIRLVGDDPGSVTVGGMCLAAGLVMVAAAWEVWAVTLTVAPLIPDPAATWLLYAIAGATTIMVYQFLRRSLVQIIVDGVKHRIPALPEDYRTAWRAGSAWSKERLATDLKRTYIEWLTTRSGTEPSDLSASALPDRNTGVFTPQERRAGML